jgi:nucleotide-binding universal stress UspA family protein
MYSQIVVPLDGSADSERALPHAQGLARAFGATLHLIQVVSRSEEFDIVRGAGDSVGAAEYSLDVAEQLINSRIARAERYLKEITSRLTAEGITVKAEVRQGAASENIAQYAEDSGGDLIVMSTRGRGGIQRLLLGSTTDRVLRAGHWPVLAIPPED